MSLLKCVHFVFDQKYKVRFLIMTSLVIVALLISAKPAAADPDSPLFPSGWGIRLGDESAFLSLDMSAGETHAGSIAAVNKNSESLDIEINLVTALVSSRGGFSMSRDAPSQPWVDLIHEVIEVQPRSVESLGFEIRVPEDAPPGEYVMALVAHRPDDELESDSGSGFVIKIIERSGIPIIIRVDDPSRCAMAFNSLESGFVSSGDYRIRMLWDNSGNVSFKGSGVATLTPRASKRESVSWTLKIGYTAMGLQLIYPILMDAPEAGAYDLSGYIESAHYAGCRSEWSQKIVITGDQIKDAEADREAYRLKVEAAEIETRIAEEMRISETRRRVFLGGLVVMTGLILAVSGAAVIYTIGQNRARAEGRRNRR